MGLTPEHKPQGSGTLNHGEALVVTNRSNAIPGPADPAKQLVDILSRISGLDPCLIKPTSRLIEDVGIDSLGYYEILIEAQEHLGVKIKEEELLNFVTVEDIENHLRTLKFLDDQTS